MHRSRAASAICPRAVVLFAWAAVAEEWMPSRVLTRASTPGVRASTAWLRVSSSVLRSPVPSPPSDGASRFRAVSTPVTFSPRVVELVRTSARVSGWSAAVTASACSPREATAALTCCWAAARLQVAETDPWVQVLVSASPSASDSWAWTAALQSSLAWA